MLATQAAWRVVKPLGQGATSQVWLVEASGERLALKVGRSLAEAPRLADEAERLAFIDSPLLPRVRDAGILGEELCPAAGETALGLPYLALQWLPGEPLSAWLGQTNDPDLVLSVARDVGQALSLLHLSGVVHGDVKPGNILVERDAAGRFSARLVDLGLATSADQQRPYGGTPRYLAPEVLEGAATGDARARDVWALGVTLAELSVPELARQSLARLQLPPPLASLIGPLLAAKPGARPSAAWLWRAALDRGAAPESAERTLLRRKGAIRASYLSVQRRSLVQAARASRCDSRVPGQCGEWLEQAVELARRIGTLRGVRRDSDVCILSPLDALGQSRWLTSLVGALAPNWPAIGISDSELGARLDLLAVRHEPESFTFAELEAARPREPRRYESDVELALALSEPAPNEDLLAQAERRINCEAELSLGLALGRVLRRRGQLGRALGVFEALPGPSAAIEAAETARRAGDAERASGALSALDPAVLAPADRTRWAATQARLLSDGEQFTEALSLLSSVDDSAATLETRALIERARGQRQAAQQSLERGLLLATSDEERARIEAVRAFIAHSSGDAEQALAIFRSAADFAARAGAILEEASYLTGVAAAAADVGELGAALRAAERAILLFEHLGRHQQAARAALSRAAVFSQAGAVHETEDAAREAIDRARAAVDVRCRAYAHLALSDVLPDADAAGADHAERARQLLSDPTPDDELHVGARLLRRGAAVDTARLDGLARESTRAIEARLGWWGARAFASLRAPGSERPQAVVAELLALALVKAPTAARGLAFATGAELAARGFDGEAARRLTLSAAEAARELLRRAPPELSARIQELPWVAGVQTPIEPSTILPEQIGDLEGLVRALGRRDRLRPLLDRVLDALVLWSGVERGLLLLRAPGAKLVPRAARNLARSDLHGTQLELSMSLAERALSEREPVVAVDASGELSEVHASVHALKLRSVLAVPLLAHGEALGVVYLDDRVRRGAFGPAELGWVRLLATIAAVAIADARDQLLLRRTALKARRAEARLAETLARREVELETVQRELARTRDQRETRFAYDAIVGGSTPVREMLAMVDRVTAAEVPVLITGESGSGKELVARAIHENGPRCKATFVCENCAAIPEGLLESTLFGHVRGAFTGASRPRAGLFEIAHRGTLFLDEIAEMSLGMQTKLLRVLEDGELWPVGAERSRKVDVRVIGATHRNLEAMVAQGKFRQDLFYRLNVISVHVPALRERTGDVALLVRHFVARYAAGRRLRITTHALDALSSYSWPGNIRQLENEVRRALVLADDVIDLRHLSREIIDRGAGEAARADGLNVRQRVDALELELVTTALRRTGGNQTRAAELLGLSRFGLQKMMKRLEVSAAGFAGLLSETELTGAR